MLRTWTSHTLLNGTKSQRTPKEIAKLLVDTWVRPLEMSWMYVFPFDFSRWFCSHVSWHWCGTLLETKIKSVWRDAMICIFFQPLSFRGYSPEKYNDWNPKNDAFLNAESPWSTPFFEGLKSSQSKLSTIGFIVWAMFISPLVACLI